MDICQKFSEIHDVDIQYKKAYQLYPPTINDNNSWKRVQTSIEKVFPKDNILQLNPLMVAEDFSYYLEHTLGCFVFIGSKNTKNHCDKGLHHEKFKLDESVLPLGVATHIQVAMDYIRNKQ